MPWRVTDALSERRELVAFAGQGDANVAELSRRYHVSRKTTYKWLARLAGEGPEGLVERSRRPHRSPRRTPEELEHAVLALRGRHPVWGGRKLRQLLLGQGGQAVPAPSTITRILDRHGLLDGPRAGQPRAWQRFEHPSPNDLWQMDFKGPLRLQEGAAQLLTVLDDHSRFLILLQACPDQRWTTVQAALTGAFRHYGLPQRILVDNGSPWGADRDHPYTLLTVWLLRLGVGISHGRPYHPQTQGKVERLNGTLDAELLAGTTFADLGALPPALNDYRALYNWLRPHQALDLATPGSRYQPSPRPFPERLPPIDYGPDDQVRRVQHGGLIAFQGREYRVGKAFHGYPVALRPLLEDGRYAVYFCHQRIAEIDAAAGKK